jgi:hypothetical protein
MRNTLGMHQNEYYPGVSSRRTPAESWLRVAVGAIATVVSSCASVQSVTVSPSTVCPMDSVTVSWIARGGTQLATIPLTTAADASRAQAVDFCVDALASGAKVRPEPSRGALTVQASVDTVYLIQAQGWIGKPAHKCARLFVSQVLPLSDVPQCATGTTGADLRKAQVHLIRPSGSRWSATATTGLVKNDNSVRVTIRHAGKSISVPPGGETNLFAGTDPNGDWWVEFAWNTGPRCGLPGAPVPNSLSLVVHPLCSSAARATH